jgi:hypothetical protein
MPPRHHLRRASRARRAGHVLTVAMRERENEGANADLHMQWRTLAAAEKRVGAVCCHPGTGQHSAIVEERLIPTAGFHPPGRPVNGRCCAAMHVIRDN